MPAGDPFAERAEQLEGLQQPRHRGRLATGQHHAIQVGQFLRPAHRAHSHVALTQRGHVLPHVALQREHADEWSSYGQPGLPNR